MRIRVADRMLISRSGFGPFGFACLAALLYLLAVWPILAAHGWDVSFLVIAGDYFVNAHALAAPIVVRDHSVGYDGQFYYRMAVAPFSFAHAADGIRFDVPSYRSQRFLFPLLAWIVSAGRPSGAALGLFAVNLAGIGAIAATSLVLVRRLALPDATAFAMAAWPGFLVALTHDTSEIVATAFLLGALLSRVGGRPILFVLCGVAATVSRETTAPVFAGLLAWDLLTSRRGGWRPAMLDVLALLPLLVWHEALPVLWHETGSEGVLGHDFGWPLLGLASVLADRVAGIVHPHGMGPGFALLNFAATAVLFGFGGLAAVRVLGALGRGGAVGALAAGWLPTALLMVLLRAGDGPLVSPNEYCRAFSEFWVLGCVVIAAGRRKRAPGGALVGAAVLMAVLVLAFERVSFGLPLL